MVGRAAVQTMAVFVGINAPEDCIELKLDQSQAHVGSAITGSLVLHGRSSMKTVLLVFEGFEYSVVAFPRTSDNSMGLEYLKKHTSENRSLTRQEVSLDCSTPQRFRFAIPNDVASTMRCRLDGTDPTLPSQCQVNYSITATIYRNKSKTQVSRPIIVLPKQDTNVPIDPEISVSVGSSLDVLFKSIFACGDKLCQVNDPDVEEPLAEEKYILLESASENIRLSAGQSLNVVVQDWFGLLSSSRNNWMVRLVERLAWKARGRTAKSRQSYDLFANHHEIPSTLRRTYDSDPKSLLQITHEIIVYITSKENPKEVIATTEPIRIQIVSCSRGWDA